MSLRYTASIVFRNKDGREYVQIGDAWGNWLLAPVESSEQREFANYVIDSLNLKDVADKLAKSTADLLGK